jgi:uncharacterized membrane protein (DUF485 family)
MSGATGRTTALGLGFFVAYSALYATFVAVAAFGTFSGGVASGGLAAPAAWGVPWGVVAGVGLILGAFVLAVLYAVIAQRVEHA